SGAGDSALLDMSVSGTVVYSRTPATSRLVWVSRQGTEQPLNDTLRRYTSPRVAPGGARALVQVDNALWIQDIERATFTRLITPTRASGSAFPVWTRDGRIVYRDGLGLRVVDADGGGGVAEIGGTTSADYPTSVSADGGTLFFSRSTGKTSFDLYSTALSD